MIFEVKHKPDFGRRVDMLRTQKLQAMRQSVDEIEREITTRYSSGTGTATLGVRSGRLRSAPRRQIRTDGDTLIGRVFIPESGGNTIPVYARIHEMGGTIRPVRGRYLAIPIGGAARRGAASGVSLGPRDFAGGFFFRSKAGNLIYGVREQGSHGQVTPLFVMKTSVRIPRRPVWAVTAANQRPRVLERFNALARGVARGAA